MQVYSLADSMLEYSVVKRLLMDKRKSWVRTLLIKNWDHVFPGYCHHGRISKFRVEFSCFLKKEGLFSKVSNYNCCKRKKVIVWLFNRRYILETLALRRMDKKGQALDWKFAFSLMWFAIWFLPNWKTVNLHLAVFCY